MKDKIGQKGEKTTTEVLFEKMFSQELERVNNYFRNQRKNNLRQRIVELIRQRT